MALSHYTEVFSIWVRRIPEDQWFYLNTYSSKLGVRKAISRYTLEYDIRVYKVTAEGCKALNVRR